MEQASDLKIAQEAELWPVQSVAEAAGINPSLMRQYTSGVTAAGQKQYDKIRMAVERIGKELSSATF